MTAAETRLLAMVKAARTQSADAERRALAALSLARRQRATDLQTDAMIGTFLRTVDDAEAIRSAKAVSDARRARPVVNGPFSPDIGDTGVCRPVVVAPVGPTLYSPRLDWVKASFVAMSHPASKCRKGK